VRIDERTDRVISYMARATEPSHQPFDAAHAAVAGLDLIGVAATALARNGQPIALNSGFERLIPDVAQTRGSRLKLTDAAADALLGDTLAWLGSARDLRRARLIPVPASAGHPPIIMQLIALRGQARELIAPTHALLTAMPVVAKEPPAAAVLQGLFNLTPAEARVARAVAQRQTIAAAALTLGLSRETVRSQLRAALAKAGVTRKSDLAAMLAGLLVAPGGRW
jgi:DNA-binding CsgD family transcriptional regulator